MNRLAQQLVAFSILAVATFPATAQTTLLYEDFEGMGNVPIGGWGPQGLINDGWTFVNNSQPLGPIGWVSGCCWGGLINPLSGTGYLASYQDSAAGGAPIYSNWAILPAVPNQQAGAVFSFYTVSSDTSPWDDVSLQVRYSPSGGANPGAGANDVGDFTQVLLDIPQMPNYNMGTANGWTYWEFTLPGPGRVALRQYGNSSMYFGIENVRIEADLPPANPYPEGFENLGGLCGQGPCALVDDGWIFRNQSLPLSTAAWEPNQSLDGLNPHSGFGCIKSVSAAGGVSSGGVNNWAILPSQGLGAGDTLSFVATGLLGDNGKFEVRYSPNGGTSTGAGLNGVGDFTQALVELNAMSWGAWQPVVTTIPGNGRVAIRFHNPSIPAFSSAVVAAIDTLGVNVAIPGPPLPQSGETVTWNASMSPVAIDAPLAVPAGGTLIISAGVVMNFTSEGSLTIAGDVDMQGTAGAHVQFNAASNFPPIVQVVGGVLDATYADFNGQMRPQSGSEMLLTNCTVNGPFGLIWTDGLGMGGPWTQAYVELNACAFNNNAGLLLSDCLSKLTDCTFNNSSAQALRGFTMTQNVTMNGTPFRIDRQHNIQPQYVNGINASGFSGGGGLELDGGNYLLGPANNLSNNLYPVAVRGGLMPGSVVPTSGNSVNKISLGNGGSLGNSRWSKLALDYLVDGWINGGGNVTIDPGVRIEFTPGFSGLPFTSTRRLIAEGLPDAPITFTSSTGGGPGSWGGIEFHTNGTTGPKLLDCIVENAEFGASVDDSGVYFENCLFRFNSVGTGSNTFGVQYARKSHYLFNGIGVYTSSGIIGGGNANLLGTTNPNFFDGNGLAVQNNRDTVIPAQGNWWGDASGPQSPLNPAGQGDPIGGAFASLVQVNPFLTQPPDVKNHPPVVRIVEPAKDYRAYSPQPQFFFEPGEKYIIHWSASDDDQVVEQRIYFSPEGNYPSSYTVTVATGLSASQTSFVWTVPDIGYAVTHQPQFLKVVAIDAAGQEGWDDMPLTVSSNDLGASITIQTSFAGQTFIAGESLPQTSYSGSAGFGLADAQLVLENDGTVWDASYVSTNRARVAVRAATDSNRIEWFFAPGYCSIRHDPRMGLTPPSVQLISPNGGTYAGGATVPISWAASAVEGLYSFDVQASYNGGKTWHLIAWDLSASATSFQWKLPPTQVGISDVRLRVVAHDIRFQNTAADSAAPLAIVPSGTGVPGDVNSDGFVNVDDLLAVINAWGACASGTCTADLNSDGVVDVNDLLIVINNWL